MYSVFVEYRTDCNLQTGSTTVFVPRDFHHHHHHLIFNIT